jgi:hypothetical protein
METSSHDTTPGQSPDASSQVAWLATAAAAVLEGWVTQVEGKKARRVVHEDPRIPSPKFPLIRL